MSSHRSETEPAESVHGAMCATSAFLIWGLSPLLWKMLKDVPPFEILMHRAVWSFFFVLPLIAILNQWAGFNAALKTRSTLLILFLTTFFVSANWFVFIWAINNNHVLQTSLGYFINPLLNVLLGMVFLKERLRRPQVVAVVLACAAVTFLTIRLGQFPWVALTLALCFGFYGLIRKVAPVSPLVGLSVETLILSVPAVIYLVYLDFTGHGSFLHVSITVDVLLAATALVTALPLLLFTLGAKRLHLSTLGFLQYIVPSCFFLFAVFVYHEPISNTQVWSFVMIWAALLIYSMDSALYYRRAA
jgi:chloramphenicol-sensitive protein RarD